MGQLSDKDNLDLNDNKLVIDNMEIELMSEKMEMNGEPSETGNGASQALYRYTLEELIEIGKRPECQKELNNIVIKTLRLSKYDKSEIRERTMSLNRNLNSAESSARKHLSNAGAGMYRSKENGDNLILSQHFKSFNMGCHMPSMMNPNMATAFNRDFSGRGRVGSGRILSRDVPWDYRPDDGGTSNSGFNFRPGGGLMGLRESKRDYHRDEKFYSRDREVPYPYDQRYARQYSSSYVDRYSNNYNGYEEEPEWFSCGPKSQHDVIELHGFDDDRNRSTHSLKSGKISYSENNESSMSDLQSELSKNNSTSQTSSHRSSTPTKKNDSNNNEAIVNIHGDDKVPAEIPIKQEFNFEDFLKLDSINGYVANEQYTRDNQSSRFSKWFRQDVNPKAEDEQTDIRQNVNTLDQSSSKHLSTSLLNLLQRNEGGVSSKGSSIQSVEEVEAKILQSKEFVPKSASGSNLQSSNESLAFKKLLAQIQQNQAAAASQTVFNPNIVQAMQQNSSYFNAAFLNQQQPHLNGLNLMKILSEQQMQFNLQQQQFIQAQQSLLLKQQLQQHNSHPSIQQAHQQEIYKKLILLDQIQKQQSQMNLPQSNLMYLPNVPPQSQDTQPQYRGGSYRKPHTSLSHDQIYINRNQMPQQQSYLNQPAFTPTSVRRHLAANMDNTKLPPGPGNIKQTEQQQTNLLNNVNFNALSTSGRINYETNMTSGKNREEATLHQPQINAKPGRPILKGSQHHVQFAPTNYVQQ